MLLRREINEVIRGVLGRGYFNRPAGPEVTCPECKQPVQAYRTAHQSTREQITVAMRAHFAHGGCPAHEDQR